MGNIEVMDASKSKAVTDFTSGPILIPLFKFALPVLLALFIQTLYGATDLLIVGQFCDAASVSGVSNGSYVMMTLTFLISDLAMGLTILLGQKIGEKRLREAGSIIGQGIVLFLIVSVIISATHIPAAPVFSFILRVPEEAAKQCNQYIQICCAGSVFIVAYNLIGSIFRGLGNSSFLF